MMLLIMMTMMTVHHIHCETTWEARARASHCILFHGQRSLNSIALQPQHKVEHNLSKLNKVQCHEIYNGLPST